MLLGIFSDTHDRYDTLEAAVKALRARGAEYFIHCGDVGQSRLLDLLAGLPAAVVWGNCDFDREVLQNYAGEIGVKFYGAFADLELAGKTIAVLHGDDHARYRAAVESQKYDYLFHGHTHVRRDEMIGRTRIINPGALYRATPKTAALLDLKKGTAGIHYHSLKSA